MVIIAKRIRCRTYFPRGRNWKFGPACLRLMFADAGSARQGHTEARPGDKSPPHFFPIGQELRLSLFDGGRPAAGDNASRRIDVNRDGPKPAVLGAAVPVLVEPPHVAAIFDDPDKPAMTTRYDAESAYDPDTVISGRYATIRSRRKPPRCSRCR